MSLKPWGQPPPLSSEAALPRHGVLSARPLYHTTSYNPRPSFCCGSLRPSVSSLLFPGGGRAVPPLLWPSISSSAGDQLWSSSSLQAKTPPQAPEANLARGSRQGRQGRRASCSYPHPLPGTPGCTGKCIGREAAPLWLLLSACSLLCDLRELSFFFLPL